MPDEEPLTSPLDLVVDAGPPATIRLVGELDPATAPLLEAEIERVLADDQITRLVLDLTALTFLDSSGLRVFVTARQTLSDRGGQLALRGPSANISRLLDITGLDEIIGVE